MSLRWFFFTYLWCFYLFFCVYFRSVSFLPFFIFGFICAFWNSDIIWHFGIIRRYKVCQSQSISNESNIAYWLQRKWWPITDGRLKLAELLTPWVLEMLTHLKISLIYLFKQIVWRECYVKIGIYQNYQKLDRGLSSVVVELRHV